MGGTFFHRTDQAFLEVQPRPFLSWFEMKQKSSVLVVRLSLGFILLLPHVATAQQPDLQALIQRLDRLEQRNEALERKNAHLETEVKKLREGSAGSASKGTETSPVKKSDASEKSATASKDSATKSPTPKAPDAPKEWVVGDQLKVEGAWRNGLWFETQDKAFRWTVGGVAQMDMSYFNANQAIVDSVGNFNNLIDPGQSLQDSWAFRRARLRFSGLMWEQIEFFAQYEFAQALDLRRRTLGIAPTPNNPPNSDSDPSDNVGFNEVYLGFTKLPILGTLRIGRHRESLNFVTATQDNNQVWLERGLMFDAFNGDFNFSNGITLQRTYLDDRVYSLLGFFHSNNNSNRGFYAVGDGEYAYDVRVTGLPIYEPENEVWVHLGVDYSYRNPHEEQVRYRARPMIRSGPAFLTPNILNTGTIFTNDAQQIANLEFALARGPWTFSAEYATSWVTNAYTGGVPFADGTLPANAKRRGTYSAQGGYVELLRFLTRDHRKYRLDRPGHDRVTPNSTFYLVEGDRGWIFSQGAWEVGVRYDYVDLTNQGINGGMSHAVTACLNWYLNPNARIQWNTFWMSRTFSPSDAAGRVDGDLLGSGVRFNVDF